MGREPEYQLICSESAVSTCAHDFFILSTFSNTSIDDILSLYYLVRATGTPVSISWCSTRNIVFYLVSGKGHMAHENSEESQDDLCAFQLQILSLGGVYGFLRPQSLFVKLGLSSLSHWAVVRIKWKIFIKVPVVW